MELSPPRCALKDGCQSQTARRPKKSMAGGALANWRTGRARDLCPEAPPLSGERQRIAEGWGAPEQLPPSAAICRTCDGRLTQELADAPTPSATVDPTEPAADDTSSPSPDDGGGEAATEIYRVQPGDTLYGIAITLFGDRDRAQDIAQLNGIDNQTTLQVGQELRVPTS